MWLHQWMKIIFTKQEITVLISQFDNTFCMTHFFFFLIRVQNIENLYTWLLAQFIRINRFLLIYLLCILAVFHNSYVSALTHLCIVQSVWFLNLYIGIGKQEITWTFLSRKTIFIVIIIIIVIGIADNSN